jgi:glutaminyl-peptide cyclotransferase
MMMVIRLVGLLGLVLSGAFGYKALSDDGLRNIADPGSDFDIKDGALLAPILQTRVPGTPGSTAVLNHFVQFFQKSLPDWELTFQNSSAKTPISGNGETPFVNLIATRDPPWAKPGQVGRLALVAHYDSKVDPPGFIGAIDSAAPCAMLMHAARSLDEAMTKRWAAIENEGNHDELEEISGLQIILLDGEEAFKVWTHEDSIYGARYIHQKALAHHVLVYYTDRQTDLWPKSGIKPCTLLLLHTRLHWTPLTSLSFSTYLAPLTPPYHLSSAPLIGHT